MSKDFLKTKSIIKKRMNEIEKRRLILKLIKKNEFAKAKEEINQDEELISFFEKFGMVQKFMGGDFDLTFNSDKYYDCLKELKEEEKLNAEIEFTKAQKKNLDEEIKNRKEIKEFTFILAVGVILNSLFQISQMAIDIKNGNIIEMIFKGIILLFFAIYLIRILNSDVINQWIKKDSKSKALIIFYRSLIYLLIILLIIFTIF